MNKEPTLSALCAARKDSKYLAKFLHNYEAKTIVDGTCELLVMMNTHDTWNEEIVDHFMAKGVRFFEEDRRLGRNGLHLYYEMMLPEIKGDWVAYFCEDHNIVRYGWNKVISQFIKDNNLDPNEPYVLVPNWDNTGHMSHVVSKGYLRTLGGKIAHHGNLDSYINYVKDRMPSSHVLQLPVLFHDFTHDQPNPMSDAANQSVAGPEAATLPAWDSDEVREHIDKDVNAIRERIYRKGQ